MLTSAPAATPGAADAVRRRDILRPLKIVLPYVLPWWVLVPALAILLYQSRLDSELTTLAAVQAEYIDRRAAVVARALARLTNDIRLAGRVAQSAHQHLPETEATERLARFFLDFLEAHPKYAQARLLDSACVERVRIQRGADGQPFRVPETRLQDKSRRPYCISARRLPAGHAYVSALDANVEFGRVIRPIEPVIRVAAPVPRPDGTPLGIVVLNFNAAPMLDAFNDSTRPDAALINAEGYWLHGRDPADGFGFATGQPDRRFDRRYPAAWQRIGDSGKASGQFLLDSGLWSFQRVAPGEDDARLHAPVWYVLGQTPPDTLAAVHRQQLGAHMAVAAIALLVLTGLSLALAFSRLRQERTGEALADANEELSASLTQLQMSQDELVRSAKLASLGMMVAGVAHELNTPLGAAMLASNSLRDQLATLEKAFAAGLRRSDMSRFTETHAAGLTLLHSNLQRAARLIRQFKEVAADRATANRHQFVLADVVVDVLALMQGELKHSRHRIEVRIPPDIRLDSYPGPLGQIVQNLVSNALCHGYSDGRAGHIRIEAHTDADTVILSIIDDGVGVAPADLERIWDPFFTTQRNQGGTGLGLHLCHQMTSAVLGGALDMPLVPDGKGTHMRLTIPLSAPNADPTEPAQTAGERAVDLPVGANIAAGQR